MARRPSRIIWSEEAFSSFRQVPYKDRSLILERIGFLQSFPGMYPVEDAGRFAGLRRFFAGSWVVFYGYWRREDTVYIEIVVPARADRG